MIRAERHERILAELARKGTVSAQELSTLLGASLATIRRDISDLDDKRALVRTHGGASLPERREELPYDAKMMTYLPEKRRIGAAAAIDIAENSVIGLGGGTTVLQMLPALRSRKLKLITTAINIALELRDTRSIDVTLTGGVLRRRTAEMVGHIAERTLRDLNLDVTVIGIDGIHPEKGFTTYDSSEAYVNRVMGEQAREVWIVADHSKFGEVFPAKVFPLTDVTRIYTDLEVSEEAIGPFAAAGIRIVRT